MPSASITSASAASAVFHSRVIRPPRLAYCPHAGRRRFSLRRIACEATALTSSEPSSSSPAAVSASFELSAEETLAMGRVGARVRVKAPLKVYHVPKVPELNLDGLEGTVKQYVGIWKGKRISANLPFKVEFVLPDGVEGRPGPFKFFAHLREDEFEYLD